MTMTKRRTVRVFTKAVDEEERTVEQIVSVFENVDLGKDRVKTGAFETSLARWADAGDPIPVIWSHAWDDPFAHIGYVLEAKELLPGDPLLPTEIADLGGLWTKYRVDEEPFAEQVFKLLKGRRVREASFAYDVVREKRNADGTTDLLELDVIEVGPTLKGMNPMTQLLAAKSAARAELAAGLVKAGLGTADEVDAALDEVGTKAAAHTFLPHDEDPARCSTCGLTRNTLGHLNLLSAPADGVKAIVELPGSLEQVLEDHYRAAWDHAAEQGLGLGGFYALHAEATYPDEKRGVYLVEGWDDPWGEGTYFEFNFDTDEDGKVVAVDAVEVTIAGVVTPKARRKAALRRIGEADGSSAQPVKSGTVGSTNGDDPSRSKGKAEDPHQGKAEDLESGERSGSGSGEPARALLELEALELS